MKKIISIVILLTMVALLATTAVRAEGVTANTLPDEIYAIGSQYGMKESDKVKIQRYLADYPLSNADCDRILALANQADQIMKDNNTTNFKTLPADVKAKLKALANEAADIAGVTLDFKSNRIDVYKNGKLIEALQFGSNGKLVYTGTDTLPDEIYAIGSKYGMKESDKLKMVRYLSEYPLSDSDCNEILALANQADKIMKDNNTTNFKTLPADVKAQLKSLAVRAADIAGVTLDFGKDRIDVYKNGKLIEALQFGEDGKLVYTGIDTLPDEIYAIGSKYGMTEAQRVEMERYLSQNPLSDADCNRILALAQEADQIMKDNNTTDYHTLPAEMKSKLKSLAVQAADIAGVTLNFGKDKVDIYKDGKLINVLKFGEDGKLVYTGNETNMTLVVSSVVVIALVATVVTVIVKKRLSANA